MIGEQTEFAFMDSAHVAEGRFSLSSRDWGLNLETQKRAVSRLGIPARSAAPDGACASVSGFKRTGNRSARPKTSQGAGSASMGSINQEHS